MMAQPDARLATPVELERSLGASYGGWVQATVKAAALLMLQDAYQRAGASTNAVDAELDRLRSARPEDVRVVEAAREHSLRGARYQPFHERHLAGSWSRGQNGSLSAIVHHAPAVASSAVELVSNERALSGVRQWAGSRLRNASSELRGFGLAALGDEVPKGANGQRPLPEVVDARRATLEKVRNPGDARLSREVPLRQAIADTAVQLDQARARGDDPRRTEVLAKQLAAGKARLDYERNPNDPARQKTFLELQAVTGSMGWRDQAEAANPRSGTKLPPASPREISAERRLGRDARAYLRAEGYTPRRRAAREAGRTVANALVGRPARRPTRQHAPTPARSHTMGR